MLPHFLSSISLIIKHNIHSFWYLASPLLISDVSQAYLSRVHHATFTLQYTGEAYGSIPHGQGLQQSRNMVFFMQSSAQGSGSMSMVTRLLLGNGIKDSSYSGFQVEQEPSTTSVNRVDAPRVSTTATLFVKFLRPC